MHVDLRLLGPLVADREGRILPIGGPKQRAVLAALAMQPGRGVSVDALVAAVWGEDAPAGAAKTLQVYIANLRRALEPDRPPGSVPKVILTREPGYVLAVDPDVVDVCRFERALERAQGLVANGELANAARTVRRVLEDWRGAPLAGLEALPLHERVVPRLLERRLDALELCCAAELDLGLAGALVPELESLVVEAPYRERLRVLLVRALYASGRQRDALAAYQDARRTLVGDLGVEPGPELRDIERRVLAHDETLDAIVSATPQRATPDDDIVRKRVTIVAAAGPRPDPRALSSMAAEHGGTVIERGDDLLVTAFGAPRIAVDDVERGAALGLVLQRAGLAVGVATGWASAAGAMVSGAPVSRARELACGASARELLIDPTTRDLLAGRATVAAAGEGSCSLLDLAAPASDALHTGPFVGRDVELGLLASVWHAVDHNRGPCVVTLVGDSGVGTTRLTQELATRVQAPLLRVELDPTVEPERILDLLSTAADGSLVLLEHVHRATRAASWAVARWVEAEPQRAVLCVATATADLRAIAPGWPGAVPLAMTLDVPPLDQAEAGRLAAHLLGDELVGAQAAMVAAVAGGNPLFVSELAQHLATVDEPAPLPDRLSTLLASRLDQLDAGARRVLETLAVPGVATDDQPFDDLSGEQGLALDDLVAMGLVRVDDEAAILVPEVVADAVMTAMTDDRAVQLHQHAAAVAPTLTAKAAHLEQAVSRSPAGGAPPTAPAAIDALAELAWRTWARGDVESSVDALHRATGVAARGDVDLVSAVRAARRRLASSLVAGRLGTPGADLPLRASVGAWDVSRRVEQDLIEAARSLAETTPHALLRDQCDAVIGALVGGQGSSASSSA